MRVSSALRLANHQRYLMEAQARMDRMQQQIASQRKIHLASDDPAGAALAIQHRRDIAFEAQMRRNIDGGLAFMNATEAALDGATASLQRAQELAVQAANDTLGASDRQSLARELNELINHLAQVANTRFGDVYIFSGHRTATPAYTITTGPDGPDQVTYQGDGGERLRRISSSSEAAINIPGDRAFGTAFDDLIALRDALLGGATAESIAPYIEDLDSALDGVLTARADLGARTNRFEAARNQSEVTNIDLQQLRSGIEDLDLAEAIVEFQATEIALQAAMGAIGRTNNMTLLNFLA